MNEKPVTVKRQVLRSELQSSGQTIMLWTCTLLVVWTIHTDSLGFEVNALIGNVLVVIGCPLIFLVIMKIMQLSSFALMKRSKKVDFIDDVKISNSDDKPRAASEIPEEEDEKTVNLEGTRGTLVLALALYTLTVASSFLYTSQVYFVVALVLTVFLVVSGSLIFARGVISDGKKEPRDVSLRSEDQMPITVRVLGAKFRFSRTWASTHLYYLSMWIPLVLAIPLIGQLFGGAFWLSLAVGLAYIFVVEMCTLYTFVHVFERFLPNTENHVSSSAPEGA